MSFDDDSNLIEMVPQNPLKPKLKEDAKKKEEGNFDTFYEEFAQKTASEFSKLKPKRRYTYDPIKHKSL